MNVLVVVAVYISTYCSGLVASGQCMFELVVMAVYVSTCSSGLVGSVWQYMYLIVTMVIQMWCLLSYSGKKKSHEKLAVGNKDVRPTVEKLAVAN